MLVIQLLILVLYHGSVNRTKQFFNYVYTINVYYYTYIIIDSGSNAIYGIN
jgi:hypothetical protein